MHDVAAGIRSPSCWIEQFPRLDAAECAHSFNPLTPLTPLSSAHCWIRYQLAAVLLSVVGFNSWNQLGCNYDEAKIRAVADSMVSNGLSAAGYRYLVLDDCWMDRARNTTNCPAGSPAPCWQFDKQRFPAGGKALIDYVHERGLLFGLYSSAGPKTCQGLPASLGREVADAQWLAAMEVDYFKYDNCGSEGVTEAEQQNRVRTMSDAVLATGRPIFMSLCEWNGHTGNPFDWVRSLGNSWRTDGDINPHVRILFYTAMMP